MCSLDACRTKCQSGESVSKSVCVAVDAACTHTCKFAVRSPYIALYTLCMAEASLRAAAGRPRGKSSGKSKRGAPAEVNRSEGGLRPAERGREGEVNRSSEGGPQAPPLRAPSLRSDLQLPSSEGEPLTAAEMLRDFPRPQGLSQEVWRETLERAEREGLLSRVAIPDDNPELEALIEAVAEAKMEMDRHPYPPPPPEGVPEEQWAMMLAEAEMELELGVTREQLDARVGARAGAIRAGAAGAANRQQPGSPSPSLPYGARFEYDGPDDPSVRQAELQEADRLLALLPEITPTPPPGVPAHVWKVIYFEAERRQAWADVVAERKGGGAPATVEARAGMAATVEARAGMAAGGGGGGNGVEGGGEGAASSSSPRPLRWHPLPPPDPERLCAFQFPAMQRAGCKWWDAPCHARRAWEAAQAAARWAAEQAKLAIEAYARRLRELEAACAADRDRRIANDPKIAQHDQACEAWGGMCGGACETVVEFVVDAGCVAACMGGCAVGGLPGVCHARDAICRGMNAFCNWTGDIPLPDLSCSFLH
jgi:hypothetical protein